MTPPPEKLVPRESQQPSNRLSWTRTGSPLDAPFVLNIETQSSISVTLGESLVTRFQPISIPETDEPPVLSIWNICRYPEPEGTLMLWKSLFVKTHELDPPPPLYWFNLMPALVVTVLWTKRIFCQLGQSR